MTRRENSFCARFKSHLCGDSGPSCSSVEVLHSLEALLPRSRLNPVTYLARPEFAGEMRTRINPVEPGSVIHASVQPSLA